MTNVKEKLLAIQTELKAPKSNYNSFGKYKYRSAEDILEAIKPLCKKHGALIFITEDVINTGNSDIIHCTAVIQDVKSDDKVQSVAFAGIEKAGGMALPQAFGSASSYAKKYALGNLLLIDDTKDADATNTHGGVEKPELTPSHKNWKQAVAVVKDGKMDALKKRYTVSTSNEAKLLKEAKS